MSDFIAAISPLAARHADSVRVSPPPPMAADATLAPPFITRRRRAAAAAFRAVFAAADAAPVSAICHAIEREFLHLFCLPRRAAPPLPRRRAE